MNVLVMEDEKMELKSKLKVVMAEKEITNRELARITGLHENYISDLRNRRKEPGIYNALRVANALNVDVEDIWYIKK